MSTAGSGDGGEDDKQPPNGSKEFTNSPNAFMKFLQGVGISKEEFATRVKDKFRYYVTTRKVEKLETVNEENENDEESGNVETSDGERSSVSPTSSVSAETAGSSSNQQGPSNSVQKLTRPSKTDTKGRPRVTNSKTPSNEIGETSPITSEEEESCYKEPANDSQSVDTTVPHQPESIENENANLNEQIQNEALVPPIAIRTSSTNEDDEQELTIDEDDVDVCVDDIEDPIQFPETDGFNDPKRSSNDETVSPGFPDDSQDEEQDANAVDVDMPELESAEYVTATVMSPLLDEQIIQAFESDYETGEIQLQDDSDDDSSSDFEPDHSTKRKRHVSKVGSSGRKRKSVDDDSVEQNEKSKRQKSSSTRKRRNTVEESQEVQPSTSKSRRTTIETNNDDEPNPTTLATPEVESEIQNVEKDLEIQVRPPSEVSNNEVPRVEVSQSGVQQTEESDENQIIEELASSPEGTSVASGEDDSSLTSVNASSTLKKKSQIKAPNASNTTPTIENDSSKDLEGNNADLEETVNPSTVFEATDSSGEKTIEPTVAPRTLDTIVRTLDDQPENGASQAKTTEQVEIITLSDDEDDCVTTQTMREVTVTIPQLKEELEERSRLDKERGQDLPYPFGTLQNVSLSEEPLDTPNLAQVAPLVNVSSDPPDPVLLQNIPTSEELLVSRNSSHIAPEVRSSDESVDPASLSQNAPAADTPEDSLSSYNTACDVLETDILNTRNPAPAVPASVGPLCSISSLPSEPETPAYTRSLFSPLSSVPSEPETLASERPVDPLSYYITTNLQESDEYPVLSIPEKSTTSMSFDVAPASADISPSNQSVVATVTATGVSVPANELTAIITSATIVPVTTPAIDSLLVVQSVPGNQQAIEASHATDSVEASQRQNCMPTASPSASSIDILAASSGNECITNPLSESTSPSIRTEAPDDSPENENFPILRIRTDIFEETEKTPEGQSSNEQDGLVEASTSYAQAQPAQASTSNELVQTAQASTSNELVQTAQASTSNELVQTAQASTSNELVQTAQASTSNELVQTAQASTSNEQPQSAQASTSNQQPQSAQASTSVHQAGPAHASTSNQQPQVSTSNQQPQASTSNQQPQASTSMAENHATYLATLTGVIQQSKPNMEEMMASISRILKETPQENQSVQERADWMLSSLIVLGKSCVQLSEMTGKAFLTIKNKHPELKLHQPIPLPHNDPDLTLDQVGDYFEMLMDIYILARNCKNAVRKPNLNMIYIKLQRILYYFMFAKNIGLSEQRFLNVYSYLSKKPSFKTNNYPIRVYRSFWDIIRTQGGTVDAKFGLLDHNAKGVEGYRTLVENMKKLHESETQSASQSLTNQPVAGPSVPAGNLQLPTATATSVSNNTAPAAISQPQQMTQGGLQNTSSVQLSTQYNPQLNAPATQVRPAQCEMQNLRNYQQQPQLPQYQPQQQPTQYQQQQPPQYQQQYQVRQPQLGQSHQVQQSQVSQQASSSARVLTLQQQQSNQLQLQYQLRMQQSQQQRQTFQPRQQYVQQRLQGHRHSQPLQHQSQVQQTQLQQHLLVQQTQLQQHVQVQPPQQNQLQQHLQVQSSQQTQLQQHLQVPSPQQTQSQQPLQVQPPQQTQSQQHLQVQPPQQTHVQQHLQVRSPQQTQLQHLQVPSPQQTQLQQHLQVQSPQQTQLQQHLQVQAQQRTQMHQQIQGHGQQQHQMLYQQLQRIIIPEDDEIVCLGVVSPPLPSSPNVSISAEQLQQQTQETHSVPRSPANNTPPPTTILINYDGVQIGQTQYYGPTTRQPSTSRTNLTTNQNETPQTSPTTQQDSLQSDGTSSLGNLTLPQLLQRAVGRRAPNPRKATAGVTVRAQQLPSVSSSKRSRSKSNDGHQTYTQLQQQHLVTGDQRISSPGVPHITSVQGNYTPNNVRPKQMSGTHPSRAVIPNQNVLRQQLQQRRVAQQPVQNTTIHHRVPLATSQASSGLQQVYTYPAPARPATATSSHQVLGASNGYVPRNQVWNNGQGTYQQTTTMVTQNQTAAYNAWAMNNQTQAQSAQGTPQPSATPSTTYNRGMTQQTTAANQNTFSQDHPPQQPQRVLTEQEMIAQANTIFYPDGNGSVRAVSAQQPSGYATTATYNLDQSFNWQQ
ncbi:unnamed protein product [Orchesella dallaii]|uniref:Uncharacterized protein n=1 Tax=Orchesella dallaii TaxID=48710 RepID=A0ABP1R0W7_9HEXA